MRSADVSSQRKFFQKALLAFIILLLLMLIGLLLSFHFLAKKEPKLAEYDLLGQLLEKIRALLIPK